MLYVYIYFFVVFVLPSLVNKALCVCYLAKAASKARKVPALYNGQNLPQSPSLAAEVSGPLSNAKCNGSQEPPHRTGPRSVQPILHSSDT